VKSGGDGLSVQTGGDEGFRRQKGREQQLELRRNIPSVARCFCRKATGRFGDDHLPPLPALRRNRNVYLWLSQLSRSDVEVRKGHETAPHFHPDAPRRGITMFIRSAGHRGNKYVLPEK
jgi:hypothetical protein